jgi:hypothetical protein
LDLKVAENLLNLPAEPLANRNANNGLEER